VEAAAGCGLERSGGEAQLGDELRSVVAERVRPHRCGGRGESWALLAAHHARLEELFGDGLTVVKAGELLAREGVAVPQRTLHRYALEVLGYGRASRRARCRSLTASRAPSCRLTSAGWACWTTRPPGAAA
jgi:hypothetical protein